jgi:predicted N-formylglutamate amidohydrolase
MWPDPPAALAGSGHEILREAAWEQFGAPVAGGCLMILDHASAHVPADIDLGVTFDPRSDHEGVDIGVREVAAEALLRIPHSWAILGGVSRLVIDCNRDSAAPGLIPAHSDDLAIPGNAALDAAGRAARIARYYAPYHAHLAHSIARWRPALILSIHSFTPALASAPAEPRPWDVGILYNADARLAPLAIDWFGRMGLHVGDQLPYSGRVLNHTMNVHAEGNGIPYIGVEIRQDHLSSPDGWRRFGEYMAGLAAECRKNLATLPPPPQ